MARKNEKPKIIKALATCVSEFQVRKGTEKKRTAVQQLEQVKKQLSSLEKNVAEVKNAVSTENG